MQREGNRVTWPNDDDGDVFRSLEEKGFDFEKEYDIDINLDFNHWPLSSDELSKIQFLYPKAEVVNPDEGENIGNGINFGFIQFQVRATISYKFITELQISITKKISKYGGWCNSWGVGQR